MQTHGTLTSYIQKCRCELCKAANRDSQRAHRERVKLGTTCKPRPPKKASKPERPAVPLLRSYSGHPVAEGSVGWTLVGDVEEGGGTDRMWSVAIKKENEQGWSVVKVAANGYAKSKANYWLQWNGERMAKGSEWILMVANRPEMARRVVAALASHALT